MKKDVILIERNVAYINDCTIYAYKIDPFANLKSDKNDLLGAAKVLEDVLKAINMQGGIVSIPKVFDKGLAKKWYNDQYDKYFKVNLKKETERLSKGFIDSSANAIMNDYYLYFIENRNEMFMKKNINFKSIFENIWNPVRSERDFALMFDEALITNDVMYNQASNYYTQISELDSEELKRLINVLDFPMLNKVEMHSKYEKAEVDHIKTRYYNSLSETNNEIYSKYLTITTFPDATTATLGLGDIMNLPYPIYMHIKFDFKHNDDFITSLEQKKNIINSDIKDYQKNTHQTNYDDLKTKASVDKLYKGTINSNIDIDFTIRFQVYFRVSGKNLERVNRQYSRIFKELEKKKFYSSTLEGQQAEAHNNFRMEVNTLYLNTHESDLSYFTFLNPLGSSVVGMEEGFLLLKDFYKKSSVPFSFRAIMNGKTKNASSTGIITGGTGSGKTFLADVLTFNAVFFEGYKGIKILPKSDKLKFGTNLSYLKNHIKVMRIGDLENIEVYRGVLDPCVLYKHNHSMMLDNVKSLIKSYSDSYGIKYAEYEINEIINNITNEKLPLTLMEVTNRMSMLENCKELGLTLYNRKDQPLDSLFFSKDGINSIIFDKLYNVIQLTNLPRKTNEQTSNSVEYKVDQLLVDQVFAMLNKLIEDRISNDDYEYVLEYDEYKLISQYPMGKAMPYNLNRILRSTASHMLLITQNTTDVEPGIFNNVGYFFIGALENISEIEYGEKYYKLSEFGQKFLKERYELAIANNSRKEKTFPFVFSDPNNNTSIVYAEVKDKDVLEDFKDVKIKEKSQL